MLNVPVRENKKLEAVVARINGHVTLNTYWYCSNINAIDRLGINDHGPVHIRIVANLALKILRMLVEAGVQPSVEKHHKLTKDDAEVIVVLGACLHDIGHIVHRTNHEPFSVALAADLLPDLLRDIYSERERAIITSEVLARGLRARDRNRAADGRSWGRQDRGRFRYGGGASAHSL
jgi:metal-dependent HD superfamily phosphatase/phosphodiesterase